MGVSSHQILTPQEEFADMFRWMGTRCMGKQLGSWETLGLDARADANLDDKTIVPPITIKELTHWFINFFDMGLQNDKNCKKTYWLLPLILLLLLIPSCNGAKVFKNYIYSFNTNTVKV